MYIIIGAVGGGLLLCGALLIGIIVVRRKRKNQGKSTPKEDNGMELALTKNVSEASSVSEKKLSTNQRLDTSVRKEGSMNASRKDSTASLQGKNSMRGSIDLPITVEEENLKTFELLLNEPNLELAAAICDVTAATEADSIAKTMVQLFGTRSPALINMMLDREIENASSSGTLLRSNSMASKLFKCYAAEVGTDFLQKTLKPSVDDILKNCTAGGASCEVDPLKLPTGESVEKNQERVSKNFR